MCTSVSRFCHVVWEPATDLDLTGHGGTVPLRVRAKLEQELCTGQTGEQKARETAVQDDKEMSSWRQSTATHEGDKDQ